MIRINYPKKEFRLRKEEGSDQIFDRFRRLWVKLTPEEWVRQNFLAYLSEELGYPDALIAVEKEIQLGDRPKRFDILVYDRLHQPWMIVECKAMSVALSPEVIEQVLRYAITVPARYLIITNGEYCYGWLREEGVMKELGELPGF